MKRRRGSRGLDTSRIPTIFQFPGRQGLPEAILLPVSVFMVEGEMKLEEYAMKKRAKKELDEILSRYADILNEQGAESREELAFLAKYAGEDEVLALLHGVRAVKALFSAYGDFPDLGQAKGRGRTPASKTL